MAKSMADFFYPSCKEKVDLSGMWNEFMWGEENPNPKKSLVIRVLVIKKWGKYCTKSAFDEILRYGNSMFIQDMVKAVERNEFSEGKVRINGTEITCNILLLRTYIKMFREPEYARRNIQLNISGITVENFKLMYDWITNRKKSFTGSEIIELYGAAKEFLISELENYCLECITEEDQFRRFTAFCCYTLAYRPQTLSLAETLLPRISFYFLTIVTTIEFTRLNAFQLAQLITAPNLAVQSEVEVFYSIIIWINIKFDERKRYIDIIMRYVRFEILPTLFLIKLLKSDVEPIALKCITTYIFKRAEIGLKWQLDNSYPENNELISWSPARLQIIDLKCPYVEKLDTEGVSISFTEYVSYLHVIQERFSVNGGKAANEDDGNLSATKVNPSKEADNLLVNIAANFEVFPIVQDNQMLGTEVITEVMPKEGENNDSSVDLITL